MNDVFVVAAEVLESSDGVRECVEALYEKGLYRQALDAGEEAWGPVRQWQGLESRLLGARILSQLGLFRTASAMVLSCWRKEPHTFDLCYAYVRTLYNLHGPYHGRRAMLALQGSIAPSPDQKARWLGLSSIIHAAYRDWDLAHACIDEAMQLAGTAEEYLFERAWLFELQDRYTEALSVLSTLPAGTPNRERVLIQGRCRLLEIMGRHDEMMTEMLDAFERFESVDLGMRLHYFLIEREQLDEADVCLDRVIALVPAGEAGVSENIAVARANSCYRRGDYAGTLEALAPVRGNFFRKVREGLASDDGSCVRRQLDIPFIRQHHMTCAPATLTAIWRYHGHHIDHLTLAEEICYDGTSDLAERRWLEQQGWAVREFELNLDDIARLIDAGCPVGLVTVEPGSAHMQAIIGYDTRKGIYLLRDPFYPAVQEILIEGAHEVYAASGPRCIVCTPPHRREWLMSLSLRHADVYDEYYGVQKALDAHDRKQAIALIENMERVFPGHRLTAWARRSMARYDNDSLRQLHYTEALLVLYPEDLNLMVGKARLLGELGKHAERLLFLEGCRQKGIRHPYLLQVLADQLAEDSRRTAETKRLLHEILKRQPLSAAAWWTLAGQYWEGMQRETAFDCYRICICLEEKTEGYATSYFKAARFLRRTDEALEYLKRRITWLGSLSANPYITYARALSLLDRGADSVVALEQALVRHPEDAYLVAEVFDYHLAAGRHEKAEELLADNGHLLSAALRLHKQARLAEHRSDRSAEQVAWRELLALQPRNETAVSQIARLLGEGGCVDESIYFLDKNLEENPHNLWLLHEKLTYVRQLPVELRREHIDAMLVLHPEDVRILVAVARQRRAEGDAAEAIVFLRQAVDIDSDEAWVYLELGDCFLDAGQVSEARAAYERAVSIAVDTDGAFSRLLSTHASFEAKRGALEFIHAELMRQVSFGNGLLEFQQLARRYLPDEQLKNFLDVVLEVRPDLWQSWVASARFLLETDNLEDAGRLLDEASCRFPLLPRVWAERAEVRRLSDDLAGAESDLRTAISINPHYGTAITRLSDVLEMSGRQQEALDVMRKALHLSPGHAPYAGYYSDLLWRMGDREEAWNVMARALELSPEYGWGWGQFRRWSEVLERQAEAEAHAFSLAQKFPDSVDLWQRCAEMTSVIENKKTSLDRALGLAPYRADILQDMCNLLVDEGDVAGARKLIARTFSGVVSKPTEIRTYEAWLTMRTGHAGEAIAEMEQVVASDPAHYNAWRLLALWQHQQDNGKECCRCARQCVALLPQDASALVTASEYLLGHPDAAAEGGDAASVRNEIYGWLERAISLDHTNMYNALTLADMYLDDGRLDECSILFSRGALDNRDVYLQARRMRLDLLQGRVESAVAKWREFLLHTTENEWLLMQPYHWFVAQNQQALADDCLRSVAAEDNPSWMAARAWVQGLLASKPDGRRILACLEDVRSKQEFWAEAVSYLLTRAELSDAQLSPLFWSAASDIESDAKAWAALVSFRMAREDWAHLRRLGRRAFALPDAPARAIYFCSVGWRFTRNWAEAGALAELARGRLRDDSYDNLRFWQQLDAWFSAPERVSCDVLDGLDVRELTRLEGLLLILLRTLASLPVRIDLDDVTLLEKAWQDGCRQYAGAGSNPIARRVCWRIRLILMTRLQGALWKRLYGVVRLSFVLRDSA